MTSCKKCNDTGWQIKTKNQREFAVKCTCQIPERLFSRAEKANMPRRFLGVELELGYQPDTQNSSQAKAKNQAQKFVRDYPAVEKGLLFQGSIGLGKTHLLCSIGFELIKKKDIDVHYIDWNDLVREMRSGEDHSSRDFHSINQQIQRLSRVDVLLFDELGASHISPWVFDNIYYLFNKRYNDKKITLCASNFSDRVGEGKETLTQRIGDRIRSRLYEMTQVVEINGPDFRERTLGGNP